MNATFCRRATWGVPSSYFSGGLSSGLTKSFCREGVRPVRVAGRLLRPILRRRTMLADQLSRYIGSSSRAQRSHVVLSFSFRIFLTLPSGGYSRSEPPTQDRELPLDPPLGPRRKEDPEINALHHRTLHCARPRHEAGDLA